MNVNYVTEGKHFMHLSGKSMPRGRGRGYGDLFITFDVDFPETLTEEQKKGIRKILGGGSSGGSGGSDEL